MSSMSLEAGSASHDPRVGGRDHGFLVGIGLSVLGVVLLASIFGAPLKDTALYVLYVFAYVLFPGVCCYLLLLPVPGALRVVLLHGWVIGYLLECWFYVFLLAIGQEGLFRFYPALFLLLALGARSGIASRLAAARGYVRVRAGPAKVAGLFLIALAAAFPAFLANFRVSVDGHFTWVAAFANSARVGWPLEDPFLSGIRLSYHYLPNMHIAAASALTGVPVLLISARLFVIVQFVVFLALLINFAQARFGSWAAGALAGAQILGTYQFAPIAWDAFHHATAQVLVQLPSTLLACGILLVAWHEILEWMSHPLPCRRRLLLIVLVLVASSGVRAQLLPILIAGLSLLGAYLIIVRRPGLARVLPVLLAAVVSLLFGLWFFYGLGGAVDATGVVALRPLNKSVAMVTAAGLAQPSAVFQWVAGATGSEEIAAVCYIAVALIGRLGFLLPGALAYFIWFRGEREALTAALLLGGYLAGVGALAFLYSPFQEQWNFQLYGDVAMAVLGGTGLVRAIVSRRKAPLLLLLLGLPGLVIGAYELVPPVLADLREMPSRVGYPSYSSDPRVQELVRLLQQELPRGSVVVTGGKWLGFDDRILPVLVPGVQLYASRVQLDVYLRRVNPDPRLSRRRVLLTEPWDATTYASLRSDVPGDRDLFLLWRGRPGPPAAPDLHLLASQGPYSLFRISTPVRSTFRGPSAR